MSAQPPTTSLEPNTLVHERYQIVRVIGRGGMGAVYEAIDQRLGNRVAIKQMLLAGPQFSAAFQREARILAGLRHPALPKVSDHFTDSTGQFLVMEYLPGDDLGKLLGERAAPFPIMEVLRWGEQLLQALVFLHGQTPTIIHRDIKPQNLKLTPAGELVLLDFGLAKGQATVTPNQSTAAPSLVGYTPNYAPLEQIQDAGAGPAADLYAAAATLYHLSTGVAPAAAPARATALINSQPDPLRLAHEINPAVPQAVSAWLSRSLALESARRHPNANAMLAELVTLRTSLASAGPASTSTTVFAGTAPPQPGPSTGTQAASATAVPPQKNAPPWGMIGAGIAALALIAALGALVLVLRGGPQPPPPRPQPTAAEQVAELNGPASAAEQPPTTVAAAAAPTTAPPAAAQPADAPLPATSTAVDEPIVEPPTAVAPTAIPPTLAPLAAATPASQFGPLGPQRPQRVGASGNAPAGRDSAQNVITYEPANVVDGRLDTAWRVEGNGINAYVQLDFARPIRLASLRLLPGYAKIDAGDGRDRFMQNRRVRRVNLIFSDGRSAEAVFDVNDRRMQTVDLGAIQPAIVTSFVRVVILETTEPGTDLPRDFTPVSEIEITGEELLP
jgi:hypothetical protein